MSPFPLLCLLFSISFAVEMVTYATDHNHENLALLKNTARWHGWSPLHIIGTQEGFDAHGLVDKLRALRHFARKWHDDTILVFVDGYDVIVNNDPFVLENAFVALGKRIVMASENGCCVGKNTALAYGTECHPSWPFFQHRKWLNSGVIVGYAKDIRRMIRLAWKEYRQYPSVYKAYTDQQLLCFLVSEGSNIWTRAVIGIDHKSELALTTFQTDLHQLVFDSKGRVIFSNSTPPIIHFNSPPLVKTQQMNYAKANFPLIQDVLKPI